MMAPLTEAEANKLKVGVFLFDGILGVRIYGTFGNKE